MRLFRRRSEPPHRAGRAARARGFSRGGDRAALSALAARGIAREAVVSRRATAPRSTPATRVERRRAHAVLQRLSRRAAGALAELPRRATAAPDAALPSVPRRGRPRLAGRRRAADPRAGEGRLRLGGERSAGDRRADQPPVPLGVRRRQARAQRRPASAKGAVSVSYAAIALAKKIFGDLEGLNVLISAPARWRS